MCNGRLGEILIPVLDSSSTRMTDHSGSSFWISSTLLISFMVDAANWWFLVLCYLFADMVNTFRVWHIIPISGCRRYGRRSLLYSV